MNLKTLWVAALIMLCGLPVSAYDFEHNGFYYNITSLQDLTVSLTRDDNQLTSYSGDVRIPSTAEFGGKTFAVTAVERDAFTLCTIGTLTVPPSLLSANINLEYWDDDFNCYSGRVENLIIEDSDIPLRGLVVFGDVKAMYVGRNPLSVGWNEEGWLVNPYRTLEELTFGEGVTKIDMNSFQDNGNLGKLSIPNVQWIGENAFGGCSSLKTISGSKVLGIGAGCFQNCASLTSCFFPSLGYLGDDAFRGCTSLETLPSLPVSTFARKGFCSGCTSLKQVVVPQGWTGLGAWAFSECTNLESVVLPASLLEIGSECFAGCEKLTSVTACHKTPLAIAENTFDLQTYLKATLHVPAGAKEAYQAADIWKNFFAIVEDASIVDDVCGVYVTPNQGEFGMDWWYGGMESGYAELQTDKQYHVGEEVTVVCTPMKTGIWWGDYVHYEYDYWLNSILVNGVEMMPKVKDNKLTFVLEGNTRVEAKFEPWPYEQPEDGVAQVGTNHAKVYGENNAIRISGAAEGEHVAVYTTSGQLVMSRTLLGTEAVLPVSPGQLYIVKLNGLAVKVAI